jgi:tRNA-specific 2-thiouridylase
MGICFLNRKPYAEFLKHRGIQPIEGDVVTRDGRVCSRHNGIIHYTIGQRRGEGIPEGKRVVDICATTHNIVVGEKQELYKSKLYITDCNIVNESELLTASDITIKIRGIGINPTLPVAVERYGEGYLITTPDKAFSPAKGQPLVLYRNNLVIGGGIVESFE